VRRRDWQIDAGAERPVRGGGTGVQRVFGALAIVLMLVTGTEFAFMSRDASNLVDRFSDSSWWTASQFRSEIQQLHVSLCEYDGSQQSLDSVRDHYDVAYSRIASIEDGTLEPKPNAGYLETFGDLRARVLALGPRIESLRPGDVAAARAIAADLRDLERTAGRLTTIGAQADGEHRGEIRAATVRANLAFGITAALLIASLLISMRAVIRQAARLDVARRRSEALSRDLTEALAQAKAGERAKSAFLATMSHEIRTPMNGILGAASLLSHTRLDERQRRWVDIVKVCGQTLLAQLDDVLDFSALEAEVARPLREPVEMRALAERVAHVLEGPAAEKGLDLVVVVDPGVPETLLSDARRLTQVLLNLLTNAVKFTHCGGVSLRFSLRRRGGQAWLRAAVADTGPGIPRDQRRRVFEEFSRLDRPSDRAVRGTGLGLAICRRIADALGGTLRLVSAAAPGGQGTGSLFVFCVPVGEPTDAATPPPPPSRGIAAVTGGAAPVRAGLQRLLAAEGYRVAPPGSDLIAGLLLCHTTMPPPVTPAPLVRRVAFGPGSTLDAPITGARLRAALSGDTRSMPVAPPRITAVPLRLLVADDEPINREIAVSLLRHLGHQVAAAHDGQTAFAAARAEPFDCILLDLHMPGMDGVDLARAIRRLPAPTCFTRLVAVTADVDATAGDLLLAAGIDALVTKPVTLERLAAALPRAGRATDVAPPPAAPAIDADGRRAVASALAPDRLKGLLASFWEELQRTLLVPGRLAGSEGDRRLHSLAGSAASLGYAGVATAARAGRSALAASDSAFAAALPDLLDRLAAALRADAALLSPELVDRVERALATARNRAPVPIPLAAGGDSP
jgi:signal transduction histidine kinase/DNA-binding NarL/FixJ family response regulator